MCAILLSTELIRATAAHVKCAVRRAVKVISPAAEEGNLALLDKVFFFTDYFSLGHVQ